VVKPAVDQLPERIPHASRSGDWHPTSLVFIRYADEQRTTSAVRERGND
jgi:hypothetical protein